jgi:hypothetical protein
MLMMRDYFIYVCFEFSAHILQGIAQPSYVIIPPQLQQQQQQQPTDVSQQPAMQVQGTAQPSYVIIPPQSQQQQPQHNVLPPNMYPHFV